MSTAGQEAIVEGTEAEAGEQGTAVGPEWGTPVELNEFAPLPECDEPSDEPGPGECAR